MEIDSIVFSDSDRFTRDEVRALYESVGWTSYTRHLDVLMRGLEHSTRVVTARKDGELIGLCRVISDCATIAYIQDLLVSPKFQQMGVGRRLLSYALAPYASVRQKVLLTDDEERQRAFYEDCGFTEIRDYLGAQLRAFVQFNDDVEG
ncbi:GNAT family N-acetyltransferase [Arcanobacterium pinnipediorum]|uniref:GNAT family N-acetyltransferase n=1 Tax=Arcanobacterium pinnipediorum TaxID=1503041 RepID=A0ABY5AH54_9ACTO|nr:GNAT family N-acetyltransferase [Arcanobacterium pinnipediorum]USR79185.1 GNAT family N-acetyltransferase [Arcanobacterium pinnipediorum]